MMKSLSLTFLLLAATPLFANSVKEPVIEEVSTPEWAGKEKQKKPQDTDNPSWEQVEKGA